jgi:copper(I)-binding protein
MFNTGLYQEAVLPLRHRDRDETMRVRSFIAEAWASVSARQGDYGEREMIERFPVARIAAFGVVVFCVAFLPAPAARAAETVTISNAWVRAPAPGQKVAGAYMDVISARAAALVGVTSPVAASAELHTMTLEAGVMKMRPVESIDLPARKPVKLAPGALHVMLVDLKGPLKEGDRVPLVLSVRHGGAITQLRIEALVRTAAGPSPHHH